MSPRPAEEISGVPLAADLDEAAARPMIAVLDAKPGHADALRQLITELAAQVRREPGCVTFVPYQDHGRPGRFYLYEVYASLPAFRQHLRTAHVQRFIAALPAFSTSSGADALTQLNEIPVPGPATNSSAEHQVYG